MKAVGEYWIEISELPGTECTGAPDEGVELSILFVDDDEDDYCLTHASARRSLRRLARRLSGSWRFLRRPDPAILSERRVFACLTIALGRETGLSCSGTCWLMVVARTVDSATGWTTIVDVKAVQVGAAELLVKGEFGTEAAGTVDPLRDGFGRACEKTLDALRLSEERWRLAVQGQ